MRSGLLRHKIIIEESTLAADSFGEMIETWSTYETTWAFVEPLQQGDKFFSGDREIADLTHKISTRYQSGWVPNTLTQMRVNYNGRYFDIQRMVNVDERNNEVIFLCIERVTA